MAPSATALTWLLGDVSAEMYSSLVRMAKTGVE